MSNTNKLITFILLTFNGCGDSGEGSTTTGLQQPTVVASYTLNGTIRPTCHNANTIGELNPSPTEYVWCDWYCAKYQGSDTVRVSLAFEQIPHTEEGIWELTQEDIYEANQHTCKDI